MARSLKDWTNEYPLPSAALAKAILETVSWDEVPELCAQINQKSHRNMRAIHRFITDYDYPSIIDGDEYDRIRQLYLDGIEGINDLDIPTVPLREIKIWDLFMTEYDLADVFALVCDQVQGITALGKSPELRAMWELYNNPILHVYIDMTKLSDDIICIIGDDMEGRD